MNEQAVWLPERRVRAIVSWSAKGDEYQEVKPEDLCPCSTSEDGCGQEMWSGAENPAECMCEGFVCRAGTPHLPMEAG